MHVVTVFFGNETSIVNLRQQTKMMNGSWEDGRILLAGGMLDSPKFSQGLLSIAMLTDWSKRRM